MYGIKQMYPCISEFPVFGRGLARGPARDKLSKTAFCYCRDELRVNCSLKYLGNGFRESGETITNGEMISMEFFKVMMMISS